MTKKTWAIIGTFLLALMGYVLHIFVSTGYFRSIENSFEGTIEKKITLAGVEDIQASYQDSFLLLSSDDRASRREGNTIQGHLYYMDLRKTNFEPIQLTNELDIPFFPHGISMFRVAKDNYKVYAINHIENTHTIEVFQLYKDSLVHTQTLTDASMISPNDIVAIDEERFYFTNDHGFIKGLGKLGEEYLGWAVSNVVYFDGENYKEVADGIAYANGINFDRGRSYLYVASPRDFLIKVYRTEEDGDLSFIENIDCGTGVDNIELSPEGKLWIGCHPSLLAFAAYAKGKKAISPSEIITIDYRGPNDYSQEMIFLDDGNAMAASTVAVPYQGFIFVGTVMDPHFLVLRQSNNERN